MDYKQYTHCVQPEGYVNLNQYIKATLQALAAGLITALFVMAFGRPDCWLYVAAITAYMWVLGYCHWWLEGRLICLGGDKRAVGMVVSWESPDEKHFIVPKWYLFNPDAFDTDYSINLLPYDAKQGLKKEELKPPLNEYKSLMVETQAITDLGLHFTGETAKDDAFPDGAAEKISEILHAEFEGGGVADLLLGTQIALGLTVTALIICLSVPPPWGSVIAAILALLAFLAMLIGGGTGLHDGGDPSDVGMSELHKNEASTKTGASILGIIGTWVYDAGHENEHRGWNEIHPIKSCQQLGTWEATGWPADINDHITEWNGKLDQQGWSLTITKQQDPENQWTTHPLLDGCLPTEGMIYGMIRWSDTELQLPGQDTQPFVISVYGPSEPPSPGALIAQGTLLSMAQLNGDTWHVPYAIQHIPFGIACSVSVTTTNGYWEILKSGSLFIQIDQVAGSNLINLNNQYAQIEGIDFELSLQKIIG